MVSLTATPAGGGLPVTIGETTLALLDPGPLTSLAPRAGQDLAAALRAAHGLGLPGPCQSTGDDALRCLWFGRAHHLLVGAIPDRSLHAAAHITDQSDAWAAIVLEGPSTTDILARLTPLDLRPSVFPEGATARSLLGHMSASLTRTAADRFLILVFRSMAQTARHDLTRAMAAAAARAQ